MGTVDAEKPAPLELIAISLAVSTMRIRPAPVERAWFSGEAAPFVKRCLPLMIANQSGWELLNPCAFTATWDGGAGLGAVQVHPHGNDATDIPISHFGLGVLTWNIPFLFRTPPGYNLLARGPANMPKDGIAALEGVVETDWTVTTFTMNWRFTRAHYAVTFEQDEPIAMIVPVRRGDLERFVPVIVDPEALPREHALFKRWSEKRRAFLRDVRIPGSSAASAGWERDYMLGLDSDGNSFSRHQTKLRLAPFVKSQESALEEDFQEPHW